ncbi:hypothetical protein [Tolypothrix sp. PCC 7910]|uniref:hypothetical protein n=1 Tax=Tolypothrix sp. PCC 7910 TaxID=2099387 RepID=UPI001AD677A9|nr:hypothetical protein [Tolypothrix sp. PCC 7910]
MSIQTQYKAFPDSSMRNIEPDGFYQTPNSMTIKAIHAKLTAADWALWSYLQMIDPFGDRMIELPKVSEIAAAIEISERQVKRSLKKLEDLELYRWEPVVIRGQNLAGKQAKELCQKKRGDKSSGGRKMTNQSDFRQPCSEGDEIVQKEMNLSKPRQNCPNQESEALSGKDYNIPQTIQTYSDFIQTLSEDERENFLNFCRDKIKNLPQEVNDIEAWLANKNKAGRNRWEVYYHCFKQQRRLKNKQSLRNDASPLEEFRRQLAEQERRSMEILKQQMAQQVHAKDFQVVLNT